MIPDNIDVNFRAQEDFFSPELQSQYCRGLLYTLHANNVFLRRHVEQWLASGKVVLINHRPAQAGPAAVSGVATVADPKPAPTKPTLLERIKSWL